MKILQKTLFFFCFVPIFSLSAQSDCNQNFDFFLKAAFSDLFWIGESRFGECKQSQLIQVLIEKDGAKVIPLALTDFTRWQWVESARHYMRVETVVELEAKGSSFADKAQRIEIKNPSYNNRAQNLYKEKFNGEDGIVWNNANRIIDLPRSSNKSLELVYHYPWGLYFNYEISQALYFPDSNYLIIFTKHELKTTNNNTMDGFLILRIK